MYQVLIGDDHAMLRTGLRHIIESQPDLKVGAEAGTSQEVINKALKENFDIILLDISMPDKSGLDALKEIKQAKPRTPILILSIYPEAQYAVRVLKAGAAGYLTKDSAPE